MEAPSHFRKVCSCPCVITLLLCIFVVGKASSQERPIEIPRISNPISLDGKVTAEEWEGIDTLSFVSHWPVYTSKANARTIFRVAYDDTYLYFSAICFDKPELIQGPFFER